MSPRNSLLIFAFLFHSLNSYSQVVSSKITIKDFPNGTVLEVPTPEKIAFDFAYTAYALNHILEISGLPPQTPRILFDYHTVVSLNDSVLTNTVRQGWSHNISGENYFPPEAFDFLPTLYKIATKKYQYQLPPGRYEIRLEVKPQPMEGIEMKSEPLFWQFTVGN